MPIRITCPHCNAMFSVSDQKAGRSVRCQTCQESVRVPQGAVSEDDVMNLTARVSKKSRTKPGAERPYGVLLAAACVGILMLLNLWVMGSGDDLVWKIIAGLRIFVEVRVLWGLRNRQDQTALTATVAAAMMTVISLYMMYTLFTDLEVQMEMTPSERQASKIYFVTQTLAEIGVLLGINLPGSKRYLSIRKA
jgi:predicted Zn finger-like uncharacterized protein